MQSSGVAGPSGRLHASSTGERLRFSPASQKLVRPFKRHWARPGPQPRQAVQQVAAEPATKSPRTPANDWFFTESGQRGWVSGRDGTAGPRGALRGAAAAPSFWTGCWLDCGAADALWSPPGAPGMQGWQRASPPCRAP